MCDTRPLPRPGRMRIYEFDRAGTSWNMPSTTPLTALQHSAACALRFDVGRTRRGWTLGHMTASLWISVGGAVVSARYWFLGRRVGGLGDRVSRYRHWKRGFSPHRCFLPSRSPRSCPSRASGWEKENNDGLVQPVIAVGSPARMDGAEAGGCDVLVLVTSLLRGGCSRQT